MSEPMAIALPFIVDQSLAGTCFIAATDGKKVVIVTALHLIGSGTQFSLGLPEHGGDMGQLQRYPISEFKVIPISLVVAEPLLDIALLTFDLSPSDIVPPAPKFCSSINEISIGDEALVVGYPWAVLGSCLETAHPCHVSAKGLRKHVLDVGRAEIVLSIHSHPGSSGSPVVRKADGKIIGVLRGALAPPGLLAIGNLPIGTDSTVTFATSAHQITPLITSILSSAP